VFQLDAGGRESRIGSYGDLYTAAQLAFSVAPLYSFDYSFWGTAAGT